MKMNKLVEALKKWIEKREEGVEKKGRISAISREIPKTKGEAHSEKEGGEEKNAEQAKSNGETGEALQAFSIKKS